MDVLMPQLGETVAEGTISAWYKVVGERVKAGDTLFDVETDKASMDVPATASGVLTEIRVPVGEVVTVGAVVAIIAEEGAASIQLSSRSVLSPEAHKNVAVQVSGPQSLPDQPSKRPVRVMTPFTEVVSSERNYGPARIGNGLRASPYARRLAVERNVILADVKPSDARQLILGKDVAALGAGPVTKPQANQNFTSRPVDGMRAAIARRLTEAKQTIPHFYLSIDIDTTALTQRREALNAASGADQSGRSKVSMTDFLISTWAGALKAVPAANATWGGDQILEYSQVDIGVAISIDNGLVTPVIRAADTKSPQQIAGEMKDLATRARHRKLKQDELMGGVSSISNLGMFGIREFAAIINPPQSTILAVGATQRRAQEGANGEVLFAPMMTVTLACDHRVIDGVLGAKLLSAFRELAEAREPSV
jgi:pyruvate dehydrogenase E2 component (dihydrolipoamide acetyltransferase)